MTQEKQYGVTDIVCKEKNLQSGITAAMEAMKCDNKPYLLIAPNDALIVQASVIDEWLMMSIDIWKAKGYDVVINTGKPGGGGCPPGSGCT